MIVRIFRLGRSGRSYGNQAWYKQTLVFIVIHCQQQDRKLHLLCSQATIVTTAIKKYCARALQELLHIARYNRCLLQFNNLVTFPRKKGVVVFFSFYTERTSYGQTLTFCIYHDVASYQHGNKKTGLFVIHWTSIGSIKAKNVYLTLLKTDSLDNAILEFWLA